MESRRSVILLLIIIILVPSQDKDVTALVATNDVGC